MFRNHDDVVNICIGGTGEDYKCAVNDLSYCVLFAVKNLNVPGPNLSARITPDTPDEFLDECLKSIGTGLGYPALMNDTVNLAALRKYGYAEKDVLNYCMVGCIENFITGKQPPWIDDGIEVPRFLEYVFFGGEGYDKSKNGIKTAPISEMKSMRDFMRAFEEQIAFGVNEHMEQYLQKHVINDAKNYTAPFLSCFFDDCIGRGKDVNMGGTIYRSAYGVGLVGVGTVSDSLAAIEKVVFVDREATLTDIAAAMKANFVGYEELREKLLSAPKYGNNDDFVDKYAMWFTRYLSDLFCKYHTYDGGAVYTCMSTNTGNVAIGRVTGATPDGRLAGVPISDCSSPSYGRDTRGATSTLLSVSKIDFTKCACGTVLNQKYSPATFSDGKRDKLLQMIKVYFARGGQQIQINSTSPKILKDAMEHPENYQSLVVRVSGFSAFYVTLDKSVQMDILSRTQHE
jgi:formate C-acetyltransferase